MKISEIVKRYYPRELSADNELEAGEITALLREFADKANADLKRLDDERRLYLLEDISEDEARFQSRVDISAEAIERYMQCYMNGADMPPVDVAVIDGQLSLIDGFHRFRARAAMGPRHAFIDAVLHKNMSEADARYFSVRMNMRNGLPLASRRDREKAFSIYVTTGHYRWPNGLPKSYREIAEELTFIGKETVRRYMNELFPDIARQLSKRFGEPEAAAEDAGMTPKKRPRSAASVLFKGLKKAEQRAQAIDSDGEALRYEQQLLVMLNDSRARWNRRAIEPGDYEQGE